MAKLTAEEQKAVKTTAFDLQINPAQPGLKFHKLDRAKDKRFWSVRGTLDLRIIVHRSDDALLLCYAGHHDDAYAWAERRKLEVHPRTGAAQLVEIRETVHEITVPKYVEVQAPAPPKSKLFASLSDETLLGYGVPPEWLTDVRGATEDTYLDLTDHLPREAAEALLEVATGGAPVSPAPAAAGIDPFQHPDAQRRFRVMSNIAELERALDAPWERWTVFLHPSQRSLIERDYNGPARVAGSAGTGKTIVALHRAVFLAREGANARILLTTFSKPLANGLKTNLRRLIGNEPLLGERIEVYSLDDIGIRLHELNIGRPKIASRETIQQLLNGIAAEVPGAKFSVHFLLNEWEQVVDAWQINTWEAYRDVVRLGRKTRLPEKQRAELWTIFDRLCTVLRERGLITTARMFDALAAKFANSNHLPFTSIVVDEAQDVSVAQLRFLAAIGASRQNGLFFAGDLGQRIFQQPFSWKALDVDVRGRSFTLRINYRTSHQIRARADRLLGPEVSDVDGISERRAGTVSTFNGPAPVVRTFASSDDEATAVSLWLADRREEGIVPHEIGVFVRSTNQLQRARTAVKLAGIPFNILDENVESSSGFASISTMHLAKGLEFRCVVVMACDDEVLPLQERIEAIGDDADLGDVYATERHLLYVACTRARDYLLITGVEPASEFLEDLGA